MIMKAAVFIAYEFPDPWASRMIDVDADFARLCRRLEEKNILVTRYGPVIYRCAANEDPQLYGHPVALWAGAAGVMPMDQAHESDGLMRSVPDFVLEFLT